MKSYITNDIYRLISNIFSHPDTQVHKKNSKLNLKIFHHNTPVSIEITCNELLNIINTSDITLSCMSCGHTITTPYTQINNQIDPPTCPICYHVFPTIYKEELVQIVSKVIDTFIPENN